MRRRLLLMSMAVMSIFRLVMPMLLLAAALPAAAQRLHRYTVSVDEQLTEVQVRACFDGAAAQALVADSLDAAGLLQEARIEGDAKRLEPNGAEIRLGALAPDRCVQTVSALTSRGGRHQRDRRPGRRIGNDLISDVSQWLWRPSGMAADDDIEIRFALPEGLSASAPWRPERDAQGAIVGYRVGKAPSDWPALVAFGHFTPQEIDVAGARLRVAVLHGAPSPEWSFIESWLRHAAQSVATLYGRLPVDDAQVLVVPGARGDEPVPSAFVLRGGQPSLHFFINQRRSLQEFLQDWSAVHEMSHLFLPYVRPQDAWLSEGLASYYQHVLRARAGTITADEAWTALRSSFRRAMYGAPGMTLADATERMYRNGAFQRVYWEGAALMLMADQRLRERTQGRESLDTVLARLHDCCLAAERDWQAVTLFEKLDALSGTSVFAELFELQARERNFPDLQPTWRALGLEWPEGAERVRLVADAPRSADRDAMMMPAPALH